MSRIRTLAPLAALVFLQDAALSQWIDSLPTPLRRSILWSADHEEGSLYDWDYGGHPDAGGGIFNTGGNEVEAVAVKDFAHSGRWSARATITNAIRAMNGSRAVRLMRWTDKPWYEGGDFFPDKAYYSAWYYFPQTYNPNKYEPWDPGDGGWWNLFQFKSDDAQGVSRSMFGVSLYHDDSTEEMTLYVYSQANPPHSFGPLVHKPVPVGRWFQLEALYEASTTDQGRIVLWLDGVRLIDIRKVQTVLPGGSESAVWGIGNYTDHIACGSSEGTAVLYYDDAVVSTLPLWPMHWVQPARR